MKERQRIAVANDERNMRTSLRFALEAEGYLVSTFADGASALEALLDETFDLAIFARDMPRMHGPDALRQLRRWHDTPAILLTSYDPCEIIQMYGEDVGFDEIMTTPFSQRLLVERVRTLLRRSQADVGAGTSVEVERLLERGKLRLDTERQTCQWGDEPVVMTVTEFLILQGLASRPGVVKTRDALMDAAYDDQVYVDDRTIDSHIRLIRKKFKDVDDDFNFIETVYGVG